MRMRRSLVAFVMAMGLIVGANDVFAQQGTAEIRGRVVDQSGGALPGATVVVRNQASGVFRQGVSTADGTYFLTGVTPGVYELTYVLSTLPLRPGPYRWHVSLFGNGRFINNLDCVPEMGIATEPLGHRLDEFAGILNFPYSIDIRPMSDAARDREDTGALART